MEEAPLYAKILSYLFIVVYMVSVTMESTHGEITTMLKDRRRMGLALVANLVIVPILAFVLVRLLPLRQDIRIGIMMLAVSPGGLFALQFARISKGDRVFAVALLIVLTLLAIFITPLLAHWLFAQGGRRRTVRLAGFIIHITRGGTAVRRASFAGAFSRDRPEARPLVGNVVDSDLYHYGVDDWQVQDAGDQGRGRGRDCSHRCLNRCLLGGGLVSGRAGDQIP